MEAHPAAEPVVPPGRRFHGLPQAVFLERPIDRAFHEEAHRVTGAVVDEHQPFEGGEGPSGRGIGRFGGTGVSGGGVHGGVEDTFTLTEPRICREKGSLGPGIPPGRNR
jgi:hypothetical protein